MAKRDKKLQCLRHNPQGWTIDDLKSLADYYGIDWLHDGGSHVVFRAPNLEHLTVPVRRPVKAVYVKRFAVLIGQVAPEVEDEND